MAVVAHAKARAFGLFVLLLTAGPLPVAHGHQMKAALTQVALNPRTCLVEVEHRFYLHDVEHAVSELLGRDVDLLGDRAVQAELARTVVADFALGTAEGEAADLRYIGQEVEGKFLWVYQEWSPATPPPERLWFRHAALQTAWPTQVNQVNLSAPGGVRSLSFDADDGWQSLPAAWLDPSTLCRPQAWLSRGPTSPAG